MSAEKLRSILRRLDETRVEETWLEYKEKIVFTKDSKNLKAEFVKDVLALANAHHSSERYLVIGVTNAGERVGLDREYEEAYFQEQIKAFIAPRPIVGYSTIIYDNKIFGFLTIQRSDQRPHFISKELRDNNDTYLRKGEIWIRRGTQKAIPDELDWRLIRDDWSRASRSEARLQVVFADGTSEATSNVSINRGPNHPPFATFPDRGDLIVYLTNRGEAPAEDITVELSVPEFAQIQHIEPRVPSPWRVATALPGITKYKANRLVHSDTEDVCFLNVTIYLERITDPDWINKDVIDFPVRWVARAASIKEQAEGCLTVKLRKSL